MEIQEGLFKNNKEDMVGQIRPKALVLLAGSLFPQTVFVFLCKIILYFYEMLHFFVLPYL